MQQDRSSKEPLLIQRAAHPKAEGDPLTQRAFSLRPEGEGYDFDEDAQPDISARPTVVTIFYSNYSGNCKALLQFIKNTHIMDKLTLKFINIDNTDIKNIVLKKFTVVPSMVVLKNDEISLYSGNNVFEWFNIFTSSTVVEDEVHNDAHRASEGTTRCDPGAAASPKTIMEIAAEISKAREN